MHCSYVGNFKMETEIAEKATKQEEITGIIIQTTIPFL